MEKDYFIEEMRATQAPLKKMIEMVPDDKLDWAPKEGFMNMGQLLHHLSYNWCVTKMIVTDTLPDFEEADLKLENLPTCSKEDALKGAEKDLNEAIDYLKNEISDEDFANKVVEAPWGFKGEVWKCVLMMKDHQMNHKMQLHQYLKLLDCPVNTETLYNG